MKQLSVVSLFTGAGGLDYGFEAAGFETRVAIDFDKDCCETLRRNRSWPVINKDIDEVSAREIFEASDLQVGNADVLIGGPPCQPFSKSSYWINGDAQRMADPRATTLNSFMRCVSDILPKVFLLENVHGISYSGKEEGFRVLRKLTDKINEERGTQYELSWKVLNAADYAVPQTRTRFFLVGHREGLRFKFPDPTHVPNEQNQHSQLAFSPNGLVPYTTAWNAIGGLKPNLDESLSLSGYWADLVPSIPEGENYLWHTNRKGGLPLFGWRTRYWSFLLKLAKNRPSWTIQAQPGPSIGPFHWENRLLSTEEMARLQTFPRKLHLVGKRRSIQRQLGNAVPSLLAEILARQIGIQFFECSYSGPPVLGVPHKRPIPAPKPLERVPEKYLHLQGDYADHPGEGKGARAKKKLSLA